MEKEGTSRMSVITLHRSEIIYDIEQEAWAEGENIPEEFRKSKHLVQDIVEDGQADRATRIMNLAYSECVEMLYPYTKRTFSGEDYTKENTLRIANEYVFQLENLPAAVSTTSIDILGGLLHEYIVSRVLQDRLTTTKKESAAEWQIKIDEIKRKVNSVLCRRIRPVRRRLSPF